MVGPISISFFRYGIDPIDSHFARAQLTGDGNPCAQGSPNGLPGILASRAPDEVIEQRNRFVAPAPGSYGHIASLCGN